MNVLGGSDSKKSSGGSFWSTVSSSPSSLGKEYTGPNYSYTKWIKTPTELGMGSSPDKLAQNVSGIMDYVALLTEGGGPATWTGLPLGNRYFLATGGKCKTASGDTVQRSLYINNVPDGNIPFLADEGIHLQSVKGLVPGVLGDLTTMNPVHLFSAFTASSTPPCMNVAMSTIDANNAESVGSGFVLNTEVEKFAPCAFVTGKNPITGEACVESFLTANAKLRNKHNRKSKRKKRYHLIQKPLANVYTALVGSLLIYIIYNLTKTK